MELKIKAMQKKNKDRTKDIDEKAMAHVLQSDIGWIRTRMRLAELKVTTMQKDIEDNKRSLDKLEKHLITSS